MEQSGERILVGSRRRLIRATGNRSLGGWLLHSGALQEDRVRYPLVGSAEPEADLYGDFGASRNRSDARR